MDKINLLEYNLVRAVAVTPGLEVANPSFNSDEIIKILNDKSVNNSNFILFPELSISSYTCGDLFLDGFFLNTCLSNLKKVIDGSKSINSVIIVGCPLIRDSILYNCAVVVQSGKILGVIPKSFLCNYSEFYEDRWFSSGMNIKNKTIRLFNKEVPFGVDLIFESFKTKFAVEICEDLWAFKQPSIDYALNGAEIIFNLSASNEVLGKKEYRSELVKNQSARLICAYVYASSGACESSTDLVFSGHNIIALNGKILKESERFDFNSNYIISDIDLDVIKAERLRNKSFANADRIEMRKVEFEIKSILSDEVSFEIEKHPFIPKTEHRNSVCHEIINIQSTGLAKRIKYIGCKNVVLGLSGGLDSTLALLVCVKAFEKLNLDKKGIISVIIPGPGSSKRTQKNALDLAKSMGVMYKVIDINKAVSIHLDMIEHSRVFDITFENAQARKRTQILMDLANSYNGVVVGTGDLSELALRWCTFNGDQMSMYGVNAGVPKTLIRYLIEYERDLCTNEELVNVLNDILETPISPELIPMTEGMQETEIQIGKYEIHDFFLFYFMKYKFSPKKLYLFAKFAFNKNYEDKFINNCLEVFIRRFFTNQFKRSSLPDGPKVGSINLSPRGDWRMPSDASFNEWIKNIQ